MAVSDSQPHRAVSGSNSTRGVCHRRNREFLLLPRGVLIFPASHHQSATNVPHGLFTLLPPLFNVVPVSLLPTRVTTCSLSLYQRTASAMLRVLHHDLRLSTQTVFVGHIPRDRTPTLLEDG